MNKNIIIFDFDGTIADSFSTALDLLYTLTHRNEPLPDEDISRLRGMSQREVLSELHISVWRVPFLIMRMRRHMRSRLSEIPLVPGIDKALQALSKEYKLFVLSSNSTENVALFLERFAVRNCFSGIYGSAHPLWKQHKLRKLLRAYAVDPSDAWYVGDEAQDVVAAHHVGMKSVAVSWGYNNLHALNLAHPDLLLLSPDDFIRCFINNLTRKDGSGFIPSSD